MMASFSTTSRSSSCPSHPRGLHRLLAFFFVSILALSLFQACEASTEPDPPSLSTDHQPKEPLLPSANSTSTPTPPPPPPPHDQVHAALPQEGSNATVEASVEVPPPDAAPVSSSTNETTVQASRPLHEAVKEVVDSLDSDSETDSDLGDALTQRKHKKPAEDDDEEEDEEDDEEESDVQESKKEKAEPGGKGIGPRLTRALLKRMGRSSSILIGVALLASLLYSFGHLLTVKRVVQLLTLLSVLRGVITKLPSRTALPLVGSALTLGANQQHFSFEYLNTRYMRDTQELYACLRSATAAEAASVLIASGAGPGPITSLLASTLMKATTNNTGRAELPPHPTSPTPPAGSVPPVMGNASVRPRQRPRVYAFELKGDVRLTEAPFLTRMVTFLLSVASPEDEVVYLLESPGGAVMDYGFMASQLHRIRSRGIKLTACVDRMAASGGYMLACVANKVVAAPFSSIGSIGVKVQTYNVERLARNLGINIQSFSAGKYKLLGAGLRTSWWERAKIQQSLNAVLREFKRHVSTYRPEVNVNEVATGEVWLGVEAKERKLVDEVMTSEEYLTSLMPHYDIIMVKQHEGGSRLLSRLSSPMFPGRRVKLLFQAALEAWTQGSSRSSSILLRGDDHPEEILAYDADPLLNLGRSREIEEKTADRTPLCDTAVADKGDQPSPDDDQEEEDDDPQRPAARFVPMLGYEGTWSG